MSEAPVQTLDCIGLQCPLPVIKTAQAIKEIPMGEVLELLASDPGVEPDMTAWTKRTGNELVSIEKMDQIYRVLIRKAK